MTGKGPNTPAPQCLCVRNHSPRPAYLQHHHILPKSWGGQTVTENMVWVCGTTHDAVHDLLNHLVRNGPEGKVDMRPYPSYARHLALQAMQLWKASHTTWPHVYTVGHSEIHSDPIAHGGEGEEDDSRERQLIHC